MFTSSKFRPGQTLALAILLACCAPAFSDELDYLPDNARVIASVNVATGAKTKTFDEFMKMTKSFGPNDQDDTVKAFVAKIGRVSVGVGMLDTKDDKGRSTEEIEVATCIKPITLDEYKAINKAASWKKNQTYKEIKHGSITIYQESYQTQFGKDDKLGNVTDGDAFYLAEGGKYVVNSRQVANLKKIIDRKKAPKLSETMQAALKEAAFTNTVCVAVDLKNLPADHRADMHRALDQMVPGYADVKPALDKAQSLTVKLNEPNGKFKGVVTLNCGDKITAAALKIGADKGLAKMRAKANEDPKEKLPPEFQKFLEGVRTALKAVQVASTGANVTASLEVEPEVAVTAFSGIFFVVGMDKAPPAEKSKEPDKSPNK